MALGFRLLRRPRDRGGTINELLTVVSGSTRAGMSIPSVVGRVATEATVIIGLRFGRDEGVADDETTAVVAAMLVALSGLEALSVQMVSVVRITVVPVVTRTKTVYQHQSLDHPWQCLRLCWRAVAP